jgi:hypothetical protein
MAVISETDAYSGIQEKENYHQRSSDENAAKEAYYEKAAVPVNGQELNTSDDTSSDSVTEVFDLVAIDPVLSKKMALVNKAIDEIGMTNFQWKMFFLSGFGYAVDSVGRNQMPPSIADRMIVSILILYNLA